MFQENKTRQIFRKTNISYPLIRTLTCELTPRNYIFKLSSEILDCTSALFKSSCKDTRTIPTGEYIMSVKIVSLLLTLSNVLIVQTISPVSFHIAFSSLTLQHFSQRSWLRLQTRSSNFSFTSQTK